MKLKYYVLLTILSLGNLWSNTLPLIKDVIPFLTVEDLNTLTTHGEITIFHNNEFTPKYIPECDNKSVLISNLEGKNLNLGIEGLFLYTGISAEEISNNYNEYMLSFYNILNDVTTLEGITYWSESRGKVRELFTESWVIDNLESKNEIPVKEYKTLPEYTTKYVHQKDTTFGLSESLITYNVKNDSLTMSTVNQTKMKLAFIKVIDAGYMNLEILIVPTQEGILYYGVAAAKTVKNKLIKDQASKSFYNRVVALNKWFIKNLEELR